MNTSEEHFTQFLIEHFLQITHDAVGTVGPQHLSHTNKRFLKIELSLNVV